MSEVLPGQISLFGAKIPTSEFPDGIVRKMKKDVEITHCRGLFAIEDAQKALHDLSVGETVGPRGEELAERVDALYKAVNYLKNALDMLSIAYPED